MNLRTARASAALIVLSLVGAGCTERLTAPGSCPSTCPGGTPVLRDTVLDAIPQSDTVFSGYSTRGFAAGGLLVANGLIGDTDIAVIKFVARGDTVIVKDTGRTFTIDSVVLDLSLMARDSTASGMLIELHRLPATVDTGDSYATIAAAAGPSSLIDSVTIADSIRAPHHFVFVFKGSDIPLVDIPAGDSGVLAVGVRLSGATVTGIRVGGAASSALAPVVRTYITVNIADTATALRHQVIPRGPQMTTYVNSAASAAPDPTILAIGTPAASRAIIRFPWPAYLKDSALLARATLELVPEQAFQGLPGDSAFIEASGVRADFGAKSPTIGAGPSKPLILGSQDTLRIDAIGVIQTWQLKTLPHPPTLFLNLIPEGASFTDPRFYSTSSPVPARRPRLRITYQLPFDFERP